jgi:hypothetical protein
MQYNGLFNSGSRAMAKLLEPRTKNQEPPRYERSPSLQIS